MFSGPLVVLIAPPQWPFCLFKCDSQTATASPVHCMSQWQTAWWRQKTWCLFTLSAGSYSEGENESLPVTTSTLPSVLTCHLLSMSPQRLFFDDALMPCQVWLAFTFQWGGRSSPHSWGTTSVFSWCPWQSHLPLASQIFILLTHFKFFQLYFPPVWNFTVLRTVWFSLADLFL